MSQLRQLESRLYEFGEWHSWRIVLWFTLDYHQHLTKSHDEMSSLYHRPEGQCLTVHKIKAGKATSTEFFELRKLIIKDTDRPIL